MKIMSTILRTFFAALLVTAPAIGQENEKAVPLLLGLESGGVELKQVELQLNGRQVTVISRLNNTDVVAHKIGWYASTPQFSILGTGEEHSDKSFSDVRASFNGKASKASVYQRGFFMGRDISADLTRAGLPLLPNLDFDARKLARLAPVNTMRFDEWQGYVSYAWTEMLAANAIAAIEVRYRALPAFALTEVDSEIFLRTVQQHCGDQVAVGRRIRAAAGMNKQVIVERYELPVTHLRMQDINVRISEPQTNWLGAHPVLSLVCGLENKNQLPNIEGTIQKADSVLSVLVISLLDTLAGDATKR